MNRLDIAAYCLGGLGLLHMAADLAGVRPLKAVLAATTLAPAPKVFSAVNGFETFSNRFVVSYQSIGSLTMTGGTPLTRQHYEGLHGPYNRRNVYGAALAYGPVLNETPQGKTLFDAVARFAFCRDEHVLKELGVTDTPIKAVAITFVSLSREESPRRKVEVQCP